MFHKPVANTGAVSAKDKTYLQENKGGHE